ncbi:MAG: hypothetical protein PSV13_15670 [Lacunisphaera sp.]|nr:hypothetical protein [Lacunisphaera sp.]
MIPDRAQDRGAAFEGEHYPDIPADPKLEVVPFQSPDTEAAMRMRLAEGCGQLPEGLLESADLVVSECPHLVAEAPGKFNP